MKGPAPTSAERARPPLDALTAVMIGLGLVAYLQLSLQRPYYFMWDMDLVTTIDLLMIQDGRLPEHTNHPGFGMYLVLALTQRIAHALNAVSVLGLHQLHEFLNPLAAVAELSSFVRLHSPLLCLGVVICIWAGLRSLVGIAGWASLGLLAYLLSQDGLGYQAAFNRTELFSVFFWAAAFLAIAMATSSRGRPALLLVAGALLGLAYLTKFQSLLYVVSAPLILTFALRDARAAEAGPAHSRETLVLAAIAGVCTAGFGALLAASCVHITPVATLLFAMHLGTLGWLVLGGPASLTAPGVFALRRGSLLLLAGFDASFLLHLPFFGDPDRGIRYLLQDAAVACCGEAGREVQVWAGAPAALVGHATYDPVTFGALVLAMVGGVVGMLRGARERRASCAVVAALAALALLQAALLSRFILRDLIWVQTIAGVVIVLAGKSLAEAFASRRRLLGLLAASALGVCTASQLGRRLDLPLRIDANYNVYGWQDGRWLSTIYAGAHVLYRNLMQERYFDDGRDLREVALRQARRQAEIQRTARFVVLDSGLDHRHIGVLSEGFPLWVAEPGLRVSQLPETLREAIVVDLSGATGLGPRLASEHVIVHSEYLEKLRRPASGSLALLPRPDLRVVLFLPKPGAPPPLRDCFGDAAGAIVARGSEEVVLHGTQLSQYCEIPLEVLGPRALLVIAGAAQPLRSGGPAAKADPPGNLEERPTLR